jgi:glycerophosphoryl diester phosphodiesterase
MSERRLRRVGHKGADLIAPGNTRESFDAALAAGVDMIEFDVLPERGGDRLLLAHDYEEAGHREPLTLEEGLDHLAAIAFDGVELDIDLKLPGYEQRVLDAIRERELVDRTLVSSLYRQSLAAVRAAEPSVRVGWSVPNLRRDPFANPLLIPGAYVGLQAFRAALPQRAAGAIRAGACHALMSHWRLVTGRLVRAIEAAGGELYVWTVDDSTRIQQLEQLGVTGVITNDPRLFAQLV